MDFDFDPLEFSIFETTFRFPTKNVNNNWTVDREEVDTQNKLWSNDPGSPARPGLPGDKKLLNMIYTTKVMVVKMVFLPVQILPQ